MEGAGGMLFNLEVSATMHLNISCPQGPSKVYSHFQILEPGKTLLEYGYEFFIIRAMLGNLISFKF